MAEGALEPRDVTRDIFSATLGSVFCCYVGQPFDTVKVRMQTNPRDYGTIRQTIRKTVSEGMSAFWKGSVPTAMGMAVENAMAFGVNESLKRAFPDPNFGKFDPDQRPDLARPFMMGALTGCCSAIVLLPSEVVKAKTQVTVGTGSGLSSGDIVKKMIRKQGVKSIFCGLEAQLMRDAPFYAFFFGSYDLLCYVFKMYIPSMPDELRFFMSGGFAGMIGWTAAMPLDVPKTNVQSRWDTKVVGSYFPELIRIGRERGVSGLFNGLGPTLVRAFPANAALFLGVESGKRLFDDFLWIKH